MILTYPEMLHDYPIKLNSGSAVLGQVEHEVYVC